MSMPDFERGKRVDEQDRQRGTGVLLFADILRDVGTAPLMFPSGWRRSELIVGFRPDRVANLRSDEPMRMDRRPPLIGRRRRAEAKRGMTYGNFVRHGMACSHAGSGFWIIIIASSSWLATSGWDSITHRFHPIHPVSPNY